MTKRYEVLLDHYVFGEDGANCRSSSVGYFDDHTEAMRAGRMAVVEPMDGFRILDHVQDIIHDFPPGELFISDIEESAR